MITGRSTWPGSADGSEASSASRWGAREIGHLHGDRVAHFGFPKAVWRAAARGGTRRARTRSSRSKPGWAARAIETRRRRARRDRAAAPQLRPDRARQGRGRLVLVATPVLRPMHDRDSPRHRGHRPRQDVRRDARRGRRRPGRAQRLGLRRARPERRRQDHDDPDAGHAAAPRRRLARACSATTSSSEADAVRGLVSLTGQLASVDEDLTGRENLVLLGRLLGLGRARREGPRRRAARGVRPRRGRRPAGQELLRRHAPPARHRGEHRRHAAS